MSEISEPTGGLFAASRFLGETAIVAGEGALCRALAERLAAGGAQAFVANTSTACDVTDPVSIAQAFDRAEREGGGISLLVYALPSPSGDLDQLRQDLAAELDAPFFWAAEFARRRIAGGASGALLIAIPTALLDAASADPAGVAAAHALSNLTKSLAVEWARNGIRVNGLGFGPDVEPAANLALYLLSGYGAYVTGTIAIADGPTIGPGVFI